MPPRGGVNQRSRAKCHVAANSMSGKSSRRIGRGATSIMRKIRQRSRENIVQTGSELEWYGKQRTWTALSQKTGVSVLIWDDENAGV